MAKYKHKYKVGDRLRVREDLDECTPYHRGDRADYWYATEAQVAHAGKVITIKALKHWWYLAEGFDDGDDYWTEEMFTGLAEEAPKKPTTKFKVGDKVRVRNDLKAGVTYAMEGGGGFLPYTCTPEMALFGGEVVTISVVNPYSYGIEGFHGEYWTDGMFEGLAKEEAKEVPVQPITVNITVNINYDNACWYCRKDGLVDRYLAGRLGVCPSCGRVCNEKPKGVGD